MECIEVLIKGHKHNQLYVMHSFFTLPPCASNLHSNGKKKKCQAQLWHSINYILHNLYLLLRYVIRCGWGKYEQRV